MADKLIVDCSDGSETREPLTDEEEAQRQADAEAAVRQDAEQQERQDVRDRLATLAVKIKDGTATSAERAEALNLAVRVAAGVM